MGWGLELGFSHSTGSGDGAAQPELGGKEGKRKRKLAGMNRGGGGTGSGKRKSDRPAAVWEEVGGGCGDCAGVPRAAVSPALGGKCHQLQHGGTELSLAQSLIPGAPLGEHVGTDPRCSGGDDVLGNLGGG